MPASCFAPTRSRPGSKGSSLRWPSTDRRTRGAGPRQPDLLERPDRNGIDLGKGKRMLVRGGKLDPKYQITVPEDLDTGG